MVTRAEERWVAVSRKNRGKISKTREEKGWQYPEQEDSSRGKKVEWKALPGQARGEESTSAQMARGGGPNRELEWGETRIDGSA